MKQQAKLLKEQPRAWGLKLGKTKIKAIDDSQPAQDAKKPAKKLGRHDDALVEKLKEELGIEEKAVPVIPSVSEESADLKKESGDLSASPQDDKKEIKKNAKPGKSKPRGKKYQESSKDLDRSKTYSLTEAIELAKKMSYTKFPGTLEAHINTVQTGIRGLVSLPFASGKKLKILEFDGEDEVIENIEKGKIDFDIIITTPAGMPKLTKVARILGPKGLLPNPKNGTITNDLKKAAESFQAGKTEYKTESKAPIIHMALGKLSQPNEELIANIKQLISTLGKTKVKKVALSPTMGPSVKLDLASI